MVKEGDQAIDFSLPSTADREISLSQFRGKYVVLYFYPKDHTPGCTTEACDFRDAYEEFTALNVVILGVSRDPITSHHKFREKHQLPFYLLSDEDGKVCEAYGVLKEKNMFGKKKIGIERSTFIIDPEGTIIKIYRKVKVKDHVKEVLAYIRDHQK